MKLNSKRIVVTGGAGFIGSHLVRRLLVLGAQVTVLDNLRRGVKSEVPSDVEFLNLDIRDAERLKSVLNGAEIVFHLAAQSNVLGATADLDYSFTTNVVGTYNVLSAALEEGATRVVFTSSREVYGEPARLPVAECSALVPKNAYGSSKLAGELYCRVFSNHGLDTVVLRLANVYGKGDRDRVIPLFLERATTHQPLLIFGTGKILDFVWVGQVVDALITAAFIPPTETAINVGTGHGTSIEELARRIKKLTASSSAIEYLPSRSIEVDRFVADTTLAKKLLNYRPPTSPLEHLTELHDALPAS